MITIVGNWTSYADGLSSKERILAHFLWDPGPMNVTISRQKYDLLLKMPVTMISDLKKLVAQGSKLRLIQSPMRLTFSPWRLKILV